MVISTVQQESFEGENFCETDNFLQIARFCRTKRRHAPKFAEKTFTDTKKKRKICESFLLQKFLLHSMLILHGIHNFTTSR